MTLPQFRESNVYGCSGNTQVKDACFSKTTRIFCIPMKIKNQNPTDDFKTDSKLSLLNCLARGRNGVSISKNIDLIWVKAFSIKVRRLTFLYTEFMFSGKIPDSNNCPCDAFCSP